MAKRIYPITVTVPAGTPPTAPFSQSFSTEDNQIDSIELIIPPGHNGLTGVRVMKGDTQLIPWGANSWIIGNDYHNVFPVDEYLPTSDITVQGYNNGAYSHSFYLRMTMEDYSPQTGTTLVSESQAIQLPGTTVSTDPLSPDAILGSGTTDALVSGDLTADDVTPVTLGQPLWMPTTGSLSGYPFSR